MKKAIMDGNEACSYTSYMFTEASGIYPITPSSPMAEHTDEWSGKGRKNLFDQPVKVIEMQSEAGASGLVHGLLKSGVLTTTYTASQGLLLMIPNMYKMAGEMLPCVMHVAARSLSTHALSIFGDHQDIYAVRATGFAMLSSSSVQDAALLSAVAHLSSISSSLPFLHFFDGFRTSHELDNVQVLEEREVKDLIDQKALQNFRNRALNPNHPMTHGTNQNDDIYFQATEVRNPYYDQLPDIVNSYMQEINKIAGTTYAPFTYYGDSKAQKVIVAMGSVCETIKETIDAMDEKVGLIEVHLYRPFSTKYLLNVLPKTVEKMAVLDRTKEAGSSGEPLYLDVVNVLKDQNIQIVGGRFGLSSKNTTPSQIKAVYDMLEQPINNFTIGIQDDVTHLSLKETDFKTSHGQEMIVYGYGSDGMVSASKSLIKMVGTLTDKNVQGYFQYDSKKSGGVTKCHLRFSDHKIRSTYYVENPSLVVVTKETYMDSFDVLENIQEGGILLLNVDPHTTDLQSCMSKSNLKMIQDRHIQVYTIHAYELARKCNLGNKISTIMEAAILSLTDFVNYDKAIQELKDEMQKRFSIKSEELVKNNIEAIEQVSNYLQKVEIIGDYQIEERPKHVDVYLAMRKRQGDSLPVSAFQNMPDGAFEAATTKLEKRSISDIVPKWISSNCIKCNMCSFVCPHGVIRPFELSEEEYKESPDFIKERCNGRFIIGISVKDCTGCGLCINSCLSNPKSLIFEKLVDQEKEQEVFDYLSTHISCKEEKKNNVKTTQFHQPKFEFHGACAGCGETGYIKLLTQLFGDELVIANATGCSSIYGASAPSMPYSVPWASSLFEDNAEYGYGMVVADKVMKQKIVDMLASKDPELAKEYQENIRNYAYTDKFYRELDFEKWKDLLPYKDYIKTRSIWCIGGDGWAYDIGFSGIDHVLSSKDNIKILVLDTQVYSNTGGQASKATPLGSTALFASVGKQTAKKDLARMMMSYPNVYVAQVSLASNPMQLIKVLNEANAYDGPAIVIAYAPCISHGIKGGMSNSLEMEKEAVQCGYFPLFHYHPSTGFHLDSKADFDKYEEFLHKQTRYTVLEKVNEEASDILEKNKQEAIKRYEYYESLNMK